MIPTKTDLIELYRKRAPLYDLTANLYYLIGFRELAYRKRAVRALNLRAGDTVVEVGCGSGLNFGLLQSSIGPEGRIIGVDLTDRMLQRAALRVQRRGWRNVELVHRDAAAYDFPPGIGGILSTFALTLVPEYADVVRKGATALRRGGRFGLLDLKKPEGWPEWIVRLGVRITRPFGVTIELAERRVWEIMEEVLEIETFQPLYGGFAYLCVGKAAQKPARPLPCS